MLTKRKILNYESDLGIFSSLNNIKISKEQTAKGKLCITGACGSVSRGMLYLMNKYPEIYNKEIIAVDIIDDKEAEDRFSSFNNLNIKYIQADYKRYILDIIYENDVDTVFHLIDLSSFPILNALESLGKRFPEKKYMYLDASNYMIEYSGVLAKDFNLVSNFQMFDQKYKGDKWFNHFTGVSSLGMNPFLVDELAKLGIERHGKKGLKAVYVIENDTTEYEDDFEYEDDVFYSGWAFIANLGESQEHAQYSSKNIDYFTETPACELPVKFTINGEEITTACPTSHEECSQLAKRLGVESTFLYSQLPRHRERLNRKNKDETFYEWTKGHVYSPVIHKLKPNSGDMVGVKLVYENREINIYNHMMSSNPLIEVVNATGMQVSIGCYSGLLAMEYHRHKLKPGIVWGQDHLFEGSQLNNIEKDDFSDVVLTVLKGVGFELIEEIYNESMGLVKDRIVNEDQRKIEFKDILSKIKVNTFDETVYKKGIFTYKDTNIEEIEHLLYENFYTNMDEETYEYAIITINDFIINGKITEISTTSYEDLMQQIKNNFEQYLDNIEDEYIDKFYAEYSHIRNTELSVIEDALLSDGYDVQEISTFLMNNEKTLSQYSFPNCEEMCEAMCHLIKRYL